MTRQAAQFGAIPLDDVARAIKDIADGRPVVVVDDADRENEGDIIFAASKATPALLAFAIRHTSGVICVPMPGDIIEPRVLPHDEIGLCHRILPASSRSTYLAMRSTSMFTRSPTCLRPSVVRDSVSGIRLTSNQPAPASS